MSSTVAPPPPPPPHSAQTAVSPTLDSSKEEPSGPTPPPAKRASIDPAQKAAEAAAKIQSMLKARGLQVAVKPPPAVYLADYPERRDDSREKAKTDAEREDAAQKPRLQRNEDVGKFTRDVEINESRNRYLIMRKETQKEVRCTPPGPTLSLS